MSIEPITGGVRARVEGRFLLRPAAARRAAPLLVGFHGYAESAEAHLEAIGRIPGADGWHLAAVQALNRFYNTRTGEVVGCWMTKQGRETAIADNLRYVADAIAAIGARVATAGPTVLLGFSQGTAMSYRAAALALECCAGLIALAGDLPPELGEVRWRSRPRVLVGCGSTDDLYNEAKLAADLALLGSLRMPAEAVRFEGGHEWTEAFYAACGRFLGELEG